MAMPARKPSKSRVSPKRVARFAPPAHAKKLNRRSTGKYGDIRNDLERQRAALLEEAGGMLVHRPELEAFPDQSDQATAEVDQNFALRLKEREQKLLKKIDEALDRMETNTYGICERCGQEIPYKRLKARPVTTLCIECKTLQEQEERIRR
ncbi:MAG TPA: RNA polymerase-binding protein DksA [Nitrospiraceae bacterium]|nr:RNA polymerase-binding protein DksA [Nitrospiraceae bacterium]